jgi:hypothetical protein
MPPRSFTRHLSQYEQPSTFEALTSTQTETELDFPTNYVTKYYEKNIEKTGQSRMRKRS